MKEFRENQDMYSYPRVNAFTAMVLSEGLQEVMQPEIYLEVILNSIFKSIWEAVDKGETDVAVVLQGDIDKDLKVELLRRIEDLGYIVKMGVDSEEEVEALDVLAELAEEDDKVQQAIDDAFESSECYVIFWGHEDIGGLDE